MSDKIVDLTEYKNNQEDIEAMALDIPDELLESYLNEVELDTPDLWSRIESGYEKEIKLIDGEKKAVKKKMIGLIAAAVLIVVIAIPVAIFNVAGKKDSKSDDGKELREYSSDTKDTYEDDAEATEEANYMDVEEATEAEYCDDVESDSVAYDTTEQSYDQSELNGMENKDDGKSDNYSMQGDTSNVNASSKADDNSFAKEIVFNDITYVDAEEDFTDILPEEFTAEVTIPNDFSDYPEKEFTVIWSGKKDDCDYIYVRYDNLYKLYVRNDQKKN